MKRISVTIAAVVALCLSTGTGFAAGQSGMGTGGMQGGMKSEMKMQMMESPHVQLAMAHKKNLQNFARTLKSQVTETGKVDKQFAEQAVEEMKHSLDRMKKHHEEQMKTMSEEMRQQMGEKMKMMEDRFATAEQHLEMLEKEVKADQPDPKKVVAETNQILNQCDMMKMESIQKKKKRMK